jgi:hypothetical protein
VKDHGRARGSSFRSSKLRRTGLSELPSAGFSKMYDKNLSKPHRPPGRRPRHPGAIVGVDPRNPSAR